MLKPKAQTIQNKFGFLDDDLKNDTHDEMMIWLDTNIRNTEIMKKILKNFKMLIR
jgi:hypothetical protein